MQGSRMPGTVVTSYLLITLSLVNPVSTLPVLSLARGQVKKKKKRKRRRIRRKDQGNSLAGPQNYKQRINYVYPDDSAKNPIRGPNRHLHVHIHYSTVHQSKDVRQWSTTRSQKGTGHYHTPHWMSPESATLSEKS
jgi:hypothetical protein